MFHRWVVEEAFAPTVRLFAHKAETLLQAVLAVARLDCELIRKQTPVLGCRDLFLLTVSE